ncbi:uncharacterized protein LOC124694800 [Lolium rigidum]|uniref:uncharacterized protein LOC124694800 n=1 Tax=Lolium rigidum TaxID=89674 RepID=UPI001F5DF0D5|nr:uncharacterized protein LOC124694800 [Lolium rigidum]
MAGAADAGKEAVEEGTGRAASTRAAKPPLERWVYDLHIFSSRTWAWTRKVPQVEISSEVRSGVSIITPSKVIQLGGGMVGFVDLMKGIAVCNVFDEMPVLRFIPLPQLMPGHMEGSKSSRAIRNVSFCNGMIKFVEVEKHERHDADERSLDDMDTLYDSDCLPKTKVIGWRAMTWHRMISWDHWRKGSMAYDKEISVEGQRHSMLLPEVMDNNAGELPLKNLLAAFPVPTLTCDCDDIFYMLCQTKSGDKKSWLISVDLKKKILVELAPFSLQGYFDPAQPSELSNYLSIGPGIVLCIGRFYCRIPPPFRTLPAHCATDLKLALLLSKSMRNSNRNICSMSRRKVLPRTKLQDVPSSKLEDMPNIKLCSKNLNFSVSSSLPAFLDHVKLEIQRVRGRDSASGRDSAARRDPSIFLCPEDILSGVRR